MWFQCGGISTKRKFSKQIETDDEVSKYGKIIDS